MFPSHLSLAVIGDDDPGVPEDDILREDGMHLNISYTTAVRSILLPHPVSSFIGGETSYKALISTRHLSELKYFSGCFFYFQWVA